MPTKVNTEIFLSRAAAVHGVGAFDWSQTEYVTSSTPVAIGCLTHGVFMQFPGNHLRGAGCKKCADALRGEKRIIPAGETIARFRERHGEKYDYSMLPKRFLIKDQIPIICPVHGLFHQEAFAHTTAGCKKCGDEIRATNRCIAFAEFVERAHAVHGAGTYAYCEKEYKNTATPTLITCPAHGDFWQTPSSHIHNKAGCTKCANARKRRYWIDESRGRAGTLYFLRIHGHGEEFYKVGITYLTVARRYGGGRSSLGGYSYEVLAVHRSTNAAAVFEWEQSIIETFQHLKYRPVRYFDGASECFASCEEILEIFPL